MANVVENKSEARGCAGCGVEWPAHFKYCPECGARLSTLAGDKRGARVSARRAERRQLTVLFSDLVDSTVLSQSLDPEDLRAVIRAYQRAAVPVLEQFGGFVSRFMGDGILAVFGYPKAQEDTAERAVRAGLGIVEAVHRIELKLLVGKTVRPSVRVGIATGLVVAGDLIGKDAAEEEAVVGETPNLASRLQSLAAPNSVLIGPRTRRLIGNRFELQSLGKRALKGFAEALEVWRALAPVETSTRFETHHSASLPPLVGRRDELALLVDEWSKCKTDGMRIVVISGEAGIGKSRLTQALRTHVANEPHFRLRFQCSPYHVNTALHPFTAHFERAARIERDDTVEEKLEKLRAVLQMAQRGTVEALPALASLLSVPVGHNEFEQLSAPQKKAATFDALFDQVFGLAKMRPVLVIVEDAHWIDPSSQEVLERFVREPRLFPVLMILTHRPGFALSWLGQPNVTALELTKLEPDEAMDIVYQVAAGADIAAPMVDKIVKRTDGIPLFVEELTRTVLAPGPYGATDPSVAYISTDSPIPETLHDSLMARLDQLTSGKRIAQVGAVVGRQFSYDLIASVSGLDDGALEEGLHQLTQSGLAFANTYPPRAVYTFKHALVRDVAYGSVLHGELRTLHRRIADTLEERDASTAPEVLARHYAEAQVLDKATEYWLIAGKAASARSAYEEAVHHLKLGLKTLGALPDRDSNRRKELEFLLALGPPLISTSGAGSDEVEDIYSRAVALAATLPESEQHFAALWGWWRISKNFHTKSERAKMLQDLSERLGDDGLRLQAHHCQWATSFHLGNHSACRRHVQQGLGLYASRDYRSHASRYAGHDPKVCALGEAAQSLWITGFPDQAMASMRQARATAEELDQAGSLVHVMDMNLLLSYYRKDANAVAMQAEELIEYAYEQHLLEYEAKAKVFQGWSLAKRGDISRGIDLMRLGIASHDTIGTREDPPVWLAMLCEGYLEENDLQAGLCAIDKAFAHSDESGLQFWRAELHRCKGELLWRSGAQQQVSAQTHLQRAAAIAAAQGAKSLELRATTSLARAYRHCGRTEEAKNLLASIVEWFVEGFDTRDFVAARALLQELGNA